MEKVISGLQLFFLFLINVFMTLTGQINDPAQQVVTWKKVNAAPDYVRVERVIDGDTILVESGDKVRYIGIDAPEVASGRKEEECFASAATQKNKELVEGKMVRLERDVSEKDKYGRLLRYVYQDDFFINEILVSEGYAKSVTYPPDVRYADYFLGKEKIASQESRGLWTMCH